MTTADSNPASSRISGQNLLAELREGWAPLPTRTLMALAMGGLRVRMMRSTVTMLSIVLAIAFLTYTGLINQLNFNLASGVQQREQAASVGSQRIGDTVRSLAAFDLVGQLDLERQKDLARAMGMDDVSNAEIELGTIKQQARRAKLALEKTQGEYDQVMAAADSSAADRAEAQAKLNADKKTYNQRESNYQDTLKTVELGRWIEGEQPEQLADPEAELGARLRKRYNTLVTLMETASRYDETQIEELREIFGLLEASGRRDEVVKMQQALDQELDKRATAELKTRLRKAGVSIEATLAGNPMDAWLIIMAMLTCAVGIANAMLMSVTERFREIGTMKCLGAQDGLVVKLFLLESGVLGVVGAVIGIVLGILVAIVAALLQFAGYGLTYFPVVDAFGVIALSVLGGIILAVVGAVYPAFAASRMRPVDALRVDE